MDRQCIRQRAIHSALAITCVVACNAQGYPQLPGSGHALSFEGIDRRVETDPITMGSQVSFEAWIALTAPVPAYQYLYCSCADPNSACTGQDYGTFGVGISSSGVIDAQYAPNNWSTRRIWLQASAAPSFITNARWTHVAVVLDLNTNTGAIYVDGISKAVTNMSIGSGGGTMTSEPAIGALKAVYPGGPSIQYPMKGFIDEVRVWNGLLTQTSVRDHMCKKDLSAHPLNGQLLALYRCDDVDPRTEVKDIVGGHDGVYLGSIGAFPESVESPAPIGDQSAYSYSATSVSLAAAETMTISYPGVVTGIHLYRIAQPSPGPAPSGLQHANTGHWGFHALNVVSASYTLSYNYSANSAINGTPSEPSLLLAQRQRPGSDALGTWAFYTGGQSVNTTANTIFINYGSSTFRRMWSPVMVAPPCADLDLSLTTDGNGAETSWEIIPQGGGAPLCSGSGYANNTTVTLNCCLPDGCYDLRVLDSFGDGMTTGGYVLRDPNNERIIDNANDGAFGGVSQVGNGLGFCIPLGGDRLTTSSCDREDLQLPGAVLVAEANPAVSAEYGIGNQADDGYQYWVFNPDGGYSRRLYLSHAAPGTGSGVGAAKPCYLRLASFVTLPIPTDELLNMRLRSRVNGTWSEWGPACRMKVVIAPPPCPTLNMVSNSMSPLNSCNVSKSANGSDKLYCHTLPGATHYRFELRYDAEAYVRNVMGVNNALILSDWAVMPPLCGTITYQVRAQASFDGGTSWCPFGPACPAAITNNPPNNCTNTLGGGGEQRTVLMENELSMTMFPDPGDGHSITVQLGGLNGFSALIPFQVHDGHGREVSSSMLSTSDAMNGTQVDLPALSPGMYFASAMVGRTTLRHRFIVQ